MLTFDNLYLEYIWKTKIFSIGIHSMKFFSIREPPPLFRPAVTGVFLPALDAKQKSVKKLTKN